MLRPRGDRTSDAYNNGRMRDVSRDRREGRRSADTAAPSFCRRASGASVIYVAFDTKTVGMDVGSFAMSSVSG